MALRSYSNIGVQIGVESTAGTQVPATKRLLGLKIDPQNSFETVQHKPSGFKVPTLSSVTTEKTEADFEGPIDYRNIVYPLSSLFGSAVIAQPDAVEAPSANEWTWTFTGKSGATPKTFSFEVGDSEGANKFGYGTFTSMDMSIDRTGDNTMSGSIIGQEMVSGQTMTPNADEVDIQPVNGDHWDAYADSDSSALGDSQLMWLFEAGLNFGDLFSEVYTINSANKSFTTLTDSEDPTFEWTMMLGADSVAEGYLNKLRNGQRTFVRLKATGPEIEGGVNFGIEIDMAVIVTDVDAYESKDGSYVLPLNFALAYDSEWGKSMVIKVTNDIASL